MTFADAIDAFLDDTAARCKPATVRHYRSRLQPLVRQLGPLDLATLTSERVESAIEAAGLRPDGRPLANDTRRATATVFIVCQRWLLRKRHLAAAWIEQLDRPPGRVRRGIILANQVRPLLRNAPAAFRPIWLSLLRCGARPGELCAANVEGIERTAGGRVLVVAEHKTDRITGEPVRIPIGRKLGRLVDQAAGDRFAGPLFLNTRGGRWTVPALSMAFRRARRAAGLPEALCLYTARHTAGTRTAEQHGIYAAAQLLHNSVKICERHYAHGSDDYLRRIQDGGSGAAARLFS